MKIQELDVWNAAMDLAEITYRKVDLFPESQQLGLSYQLRNSVTHLPANVAAAASRKYGTESLKYLFRAKGIIYEVESMFYLAQRLGYLSDEDLEQCIEALDLARRLLFGFIKYYKKAS